MLTKNSQLSHFDVVICGAGLAGLTLARQLSMELPELSVALLDRMTRPLPLAVWKVGESTVEFGVHYLAEQLGLRKNLEEKHIKKLGLRFFFPGSDLANRPEIGLSERAPVTTYQIDRGMLENDLREIAKQSGITLIEGVRVTSIEINEAAATNSVTYSENESQEEYRLTCRWIIDASGRRRLIQRQLGLHSEPDGHATSSAWFRLAGRWDVEELSPDEEWKARVPGRRRYLSTNHLCGTGYWVWLIPLSSRVTSIGIVARNEYYPFETYNSFEKAMNWLTQHEPELASYINDATPMDFKAIRNYSYSSSQIFSKDRWACVGEAAFFSDPYYSPGTDLIAVTNLMAGDLIARDFRGNHDPDLVARYSANAIGLNNQLTQSIQEGYDYLGDNIVSLARTIWDISAAWGHLCIYVYNRVYTDEAKQSALRQCRGLPVFLLSSLARSLFKDWLARRGASGGHLDFEFFDYLEVPWLRELREASLTSFDCDEKLKDRYSLNLRRLEDLLMALFCLAVADLYPDDLPRLGQALSLNVRKLDLEPSKWNGSGMIVDAGEQRDFGRLYSEMRTQLAGCRSI